MARFDANAGRQYLASLPEFRPTKPLSEYRPATIKRYVTQFQQQQRAGLPISRQAARGHVLTPEHGPRGAKPRLPRGASPAEYRGGKLPRSKYLHKTDKLPQLRVHKRPQNVPERLELSDGAVQTNTANARQIVFELDMAALSGDRVILSGYDCELNVYRSLGLNRGHSRGWGAADILERWRDSGMALEDWFITVANLTDSDPEQRAWPMGHVCFWTLYVYPADTHLQPFRQRRAR